MWSVIEGSVNYEDYGKTANGYFIFKSRVLNGIFETKTDSKFKDLFSFDLKGGDFPTVENKNTLARPRYYLKWAGNQI